MDRDEKLMATLGSRMLEGQKRQAESAEALSIRQSGEGSILGSLAGSVSQSLTLILRWVVFWSNPGLSKLSESSDAVIHLNTDFESAGMTSQQLLALVQAWQAGAITQEEMVGNFRKGEVV